jgi:hypothetical protein
MPDALPPSVHQLDRRLTKMETALPYIEDDLKEARAEIAAIRRSALTTMWSVLFSVLLAVSGAILKKLGVL